MHRVKSYAQLPKVINSLCTAYPQAYAQSYTQLMHRVIHRVYTGFTQGLHRVMHSLNFRFIASFLLQRGPPCPLLSKPVQKRPEREYRDSAGRDARATDGWNRLEPGELVVLNALAVDRALNPIKDRLQLFVAFEALFYRTARV